MNYESPAFFFLGACFRLAGCSISCDFRHEKNLIIGNKFEFNSRGIKSPAAQALSLASGGKKNRGKELKNPNKRRRVHINKPREEGLTQQLSGKMAGGNGREKPGKWVCVSTCAV